MRTFTTNDVLTFLSEINPASAPSEVQTEFGVMQATLTQLGFTSADQAIILQLLLTADPQAVSTLGVGAFPQSLVDPANNTALQQLGSALISNAPSATTLSPSFNVTLPGDYVAAGVGLRGGTAPFFGPPPTAGPIVISGIPAGATVVRAFLYWGMLDNGLEPTLAQLNLNGNSVTGSVIGAGPDTCWGRTNSFTFRADVTPLVSGNGTYTLTGFATGGNILQEGASLVVIYQLVGAPTKTVILADGNISIPIGTATGTTTFSGFTTVGPVSGATTFMVGDGQLQQGANTSASFTGNLGTLSFPGVFAALDGPLWDTDTFNVSSVIGVGNTSDSATVSLIGDCVLWSAQAFSVTSVPVTTPVTATAAVVEANANGDTVANVRGLAPTDAPTLTDQIAMVVQFRTIQKPSISGANLTTQLVTGLVNDGVISSGQASSIIQAVQNQIVPPTKSGFRVCLLYDTTHAAKSGSTIPIKFQLCDAAGNDVSSFAIVVTALQVVMVSTNASGVVTDAGNANPDNNFRFDPTLGATGGYIFNLQTTGLATGTYVVTFSATGDPTSHTSELVFQVR